MIGARYIGHSILLAVAGLLAACGSDDYVYPGVQTELLCLRTDAAGTGRYLLTDRGTEWKIEERSGLDRLVPDTLYRIRCVYEPLTDAAAPAPEARVYTAQQVPAPLPRPVAGFGEVKTDPVSLRSIWRSGDYLNLSLDVMMRDGAHTYAFIDHGIATAEDGVQTLCLSLHHDRKGDIEGFPRTVFLSVPLAPYRGTLHAGDRLCFRLNTYEEGETERIITY